MKKEKENSEYDQIEDDLKKRDQDSRKKPMLVSGRGVFLLKRIIERNKKKD